MWVKGERGRRRVGGFIVGGRNVAESLRGRTDRLFLREEGRQLLCSPILCFYFPAEPNGLLFSH